MKIKIGVLFGDNDFGSTFSKALPLLIEGVLNNKYHFEDSSYRKAKKIDKAHIVKILNLSLSGIYYLYQNGLTYNEEANLDYQPPMLVDYLTISEKQVYIDQELDDLIKSSEDGWFNSELFCVSYDKHNGIHYWSQ